MRMLISNNKIQGDCKNLRVKVVVGASCRVVDESEESIGDGEYQWVEGVGKPPRPGKKLNFTFYGGDWKIQNRKPNFTTFLLLPVRKENINDVDDRQKKVSREIVEVKIIQLRIVKSSPVGDADQHRQGGGGVGQDPEKRK